MTTRTKHPTTTLSGEFYLTAIKPSIAIHSRKDEERTTFNKELFIWKNLTASLPLVRILQPDFYVIYRFGASCAPIYQQNLNLDLGVEDIRFESLIKNIDAVDYHHIQRLDGVISQFAFDCRLQPFDYICSVICHWHGPDGSHRYIMRKSTVLHCDARGIPAYGIMAFHDVSALVSAIKPNNSDVTFKPEKASLSHELMRRIKTVCPKSIEITIREREIIKCLYQGMSSKEIASMLFISKATVDTHRQNMIRKWEVPNTAGLLKRAVEKGVL
jgi:DNA-binding CsgD family transcriptional regulator